MSDDAKTKKIAHDGETYEISSTPLDDVDALEAYEDGKWAVLARTILGDSQWRTYKSKKHTVDDLLVLVLACIKAEDDEDDEEATSE